MWQTLFVIFTNIFLWGIKPLLEKKLILRTNALDMCSLRYIAGGIVSIIVLLVLNRVKNFVKYDKFIYLQMLFIGIIGFIALYANYWLLSKYDASFVMSIVYPLGIIATALMGYFFYNEHVSLKRWIGILIICAGLVIVYSTK